MRSTRLEFRILLELINDAYPTANRTDCKWSSTKKITTTPYKPNYNSIANSSELLRIKVQNVKNNICYYTKQVKKLNLLKAFL